ncbi:MAG: hypothetical protein WCA35_25390 [Kovacikia sp.]
MHHLEILDCGGKTQVKPGAPLIQVVLHHSGERLVGVGAELLDIHLL